MKPTYFIIRLWMRKNVGRYREFAPKVTRRHNTEVPALQYFGWA